MTRAADDMSDHGWIRYSHWRSLHQNENGRTRALREPLYGRFVSGKAVLGVPGFQVRNQATLKHNRYAVIVVRQRDGSRHPVTVKFGFDHIRVQARSA
jgi:hypothetical protein